MNGQMLILLGVLLIGLYLWVKLKKKPVKTIETKEPAYDKAKYVNIRIYRDDAMYLSSIIDSKIAEYTAKNAPEAYYKKLIGLKGLSRLIEEELFKNNNDKVENK